MTTPIPDRPIPLSDLVADDKIVALHNEQLAGEPEDKAAHDLAIPASAYAADNKVQTVRRFWKACMYAFMAACGAMFDGYAISIPGSIIANPGFVQVFATLEIGGVPTLDPTYVGVWTGMTSAGQLIGMLGGPFACDRFGRRFGMVLLTVMLLIGIILEIVSKDWKVFLAARIFAGIGTGLVQSGITVYISEIAPPQIRGSLLSMYSLMFGVGQLAASIGLKVVADMAPSQFRHAFYSQFALLAIFVPMIYFIPESPWFYMRRYDEEKAKRSMVRLYGNAEGYDMETEIEVLRQNIQAFEILQQAQSRSAVFDLFKGVNGQVGLRRRTFISAFPLHFQQFLGIPLIFGYSTYFFSLAGLTDPFLGSLIVTLIFLTFILVSFFTVEAVGRRKSLMVGGAVMGICTLVIGILGTVSSSLNGAALIALCAVWVMAYALSAGPLGWTFVGETSTPRLRAKTAGVAAGSSSCVGIIFAFTVPKMLANPGANWGLKIGYLFSGLTVVGLIVIYLTIPETRARTYSELDELFERRIPANRFATTKTQVDVARDEVTGAVA